MTSTIPISRAVDDTAGDGRLELSRRPDGTPTSKHVTLLRTQGAETGTSSGVVVLGVADLVSQRMLESLYKYVGQAASADAATGAMTLGVGLETASERLQRILATAAREAAELGEGTPFEREIADYVQKYRADAIRCIYRAMFERDIGADLGGALVAALALLPRSIERDARASLLRVGLGHIRAEVRFEAARALLRLRDPLAREALEEALMNEQHAEVRRNLQQVLDAYPQAGGATTR